MDSHPQTYFKATLPHLHDTAGEIKNKMGSVCFGVKCPNQPEAKD